MKTGETYLEDTGEYLEVVRQAGTGLFMVRIDHYDISSYEHTMNDINPAIVDGILLEANILETFPKEFRKKHGVWQYAEQASCSVPEALAKDDEGVAYMHTSD